MEMTTASRPALSARQMTITGLATAVTCIIGPVAVPIPVSPVPLSLTMLALYLAAYVLGMKLGFISCLLYLLLGAVGLPVFSGFSGGLAKLSGPTGGYLIGFLFLSLICGFFIQRFPGKVWVHAAGMVCGAAVCYLFGTVWFLLLYTSTTGPIGVWAVLASCVFPFLVPDGIKLALAFLLRRRLRKAMRL